MQITNTLASIANYTATSVKSGLSYGASTIGSLGRFGVSTLKSGASLAGKTVNCAGRFFSGSASLAFKAATKNPTISVTLGLLAGAASIALIAKKRFNICVLEKLSSYSPFKGKKAADASKAEEVNTAAAEQVADADASKAEEVNTTAAEQVADAPAEDISNSDAEDTPTECENSPATSSVASTAHESVIEE